MQTVSDSCNYLQKMRKLGVTVRHMGLLGGKSTKDIPQAAERLVDGAGLFLMLAFHLRPSQSLTARATTNVSATCIVSSASKRNSSFNCSLMPAKSCFRLQCCWQ